ncbi:MAG: glycosyltransferase [Candidatus Electrothrix sp. AW2]|nr:glycosyltransferase [Candidatus Electrothrix gigas]
MGTGCFSKVAEVRINPQFFYNMKIAIVLPGQGSSGGIRSNVILANQLILRDHQVRFFIPRSGLMKKIKNNYRLYFQGYQNWLDDFTGSLEFFADIAKIKFMPDEIIIGAGMWSSFQLAKISSFDNLKVQYIHGTTPWDLKLQEQTLALRLPKIAVASYIKDVITSCETKNNCVVIPNGIDTSQYYPCVENFKRDGIGTIFGEGWAKDPITTREVLLGIKKELPEISYYIFGTSACPAVISSKEYTRNPSADKARELYSKSKVWIMASRSEGFSLPVLEAMACGCAVVATDCGGPRDIIKDGENGFLVPVGDVNKIVERVKCLLEDNHLRNKFVYRASETVTKFTWQHTADKVESFLVKLQQENFLC